MPTPPYRAEVTLGHPDFPHTATDVRVHAADRQGHMAALFGHMATVIIGTGCMKLQTYASPAALRELAVILTIAADAAEAQAAAATLAEAA